MGEYYWSMGKQKKAFKWWKKAIKKGEEMGARPELSRTFFEVGKRLRDPNCKYSSLNHISAGEYLEKARFLFTEMGLQRDLEVLEEFKSQSFEIS